MGSAMFVVIITLASILNQGSSTSFLFKNNCPFTIWPATQANANQPQLSRTGLLLYSGDSTITPIVAPPGWGGRLWARRRCSTDSSGRFSCESGDCGTGQMNCNGAGGSPPVTLAEFKVQDPYDTYDISLVDGYNLPASITVQGGSGDCSRRGCYTDINARCPDVLRVYGSANYLVGCKSACAAFNTDQYCCRGAYNSAQACRPSTYGTMFKQACPEAYSYAYDDPSSLKTCSGANYLITFCP